MWHWLRGNVFSRFDITPVCDRQMDDWMGTGSQHSVLAQNSAAKSESI